MKKPVNIKKLIIPNIPYVFITLLATKVGQGWRLSPGSDFSGKFLHVLEGFREAFQSIAPSFYITDLLVGIAIAVILRIIVYIKGKNAKKFRKNMEYGSARWDAYYLLKELLYGRRRRKHYDPIQQDYRAVLPPFSR